LRDLWCCGRIRRDRQLQLQAFSHPGPGCSRKKNGVGDYVSRHAADQDLLVLECDVLIPAALECVLNLENAGK